MKKILLVISLMFVGVFSVFALTNNFEIDSSKLSLLSNNKQERIMDNFNDDYLLSRSINSNIEDEKEIINVTKKVTYLLLGDFNNYEESNDEYYKRHKDYLSMGLYNWFPRDENSSSGYDETNPHHVYAMLSGFAVPSLFLQFDELRVIYNNYGDINITRIDSLDMVISSILLSKVKVREENSLDPRKYNYVETNLLITYYFMKIDGEYRLAYLYGETDEDLEDYFTELENQENKSVMQVASSYDSNLKNMYNYSKLDAVSDEQINNIYNSNKNSVVVLNSYYNNYSVASANGFFISDGLIMTTWNFLESSLMKAQYIAVKDNEGISYLIDGIVVANPDTDIAVIKLKERVNRKVNLGSLDNVEIEDPSFIISSKTGVGLTIQKGIVVAKNGYVQNAIPLIISDEGSPLLNVNGEVIGINTSKQVNNSMSFAVGSDVLMEVYNKFSKIDFYDIEAISFDKLKENFYYFKFNDEIIVNNISSRKWKEFSKIGNIEKNIKLKLVKANYKDGVVSLRYLNGISDYISSMQFSLSFREQLIKNGYKEILNGSKKCVYENKKYRIIIMDEFDYLIVVMVKL